MNFDYLESQNKRYVEAYGRKQNPYYHAALNHENMEDDYSENSDANSCCGYKLSNRAEHRRNY